MQIWKVYVITLVIGTLLPSLASAQQARLYFVSLKETYHPQENQIVVDIFLDSEVEINAFSLEIGYNVQVLSFLSASDENSIVDVWQNFPPQTAQGTITLEGGMIKPFKGNRGKIASLIFVPFSQGSSKIVFRKAVLYLADGKATPVWPKLEHKEVMISTDAPPPVDIVYDRIPPEIFDIKTTLNPKDKALLLYFKTSDNKTGVKEVYVRWRKWIFLGSRWPATTHLTVPPGAWSAQIEVVDGAGNVRVYTVILWPNLIPKLILLLGTSIIVLIYLRLYLRKPDFRIHPNE